MANWVKVLLVVTHGVACILVGYLIGKTSPPRNAEAVFEELQRCQSTVVAVGGGLMDLEKQRDEVLGENTKLYRVIREQTMSIKNLDGALSTERAKPPCDGGLP